MREYDLGFLGGGQLARMSIQAAQRMGMKCLSLDASPASPAAQVADSLVGDITWSQDIARLIGQCAVVTLENEFIPAAAMSEALELTKKGNEVFVPSIQTLANINDKLRQRGLFVAAGVPSPKAIALDEVHDAVFPCVIKSRFGGYDGKGTRTIEHREELESARELWGQGGWLVEDFVPFRRELAVIVCVPDAGQPMCFPTMEIVQTDHVCDLVFPSGVDASGTALGAVNAIGGKGLFGVELFELQDGSLMVNEIAPRPHNSGHYTLDWGGASQFEQHVRLVMGLPLAAMIGYETCMANLLGPPEQGDLLAATKAALQSDDRVFVHWYGKEHRLGRKLGHINAVGPDSKRRALAARERFWQAWASSASSYGP